jgi:glucose 1-dehydrogenase
MTSRQDDNNDGERKVAVVTGSSKGICKAIAREFARSGYCVVLNARDEEDLKRAADDISAESGGDDDGASRVTYLAGDVSSEQTCVSLIEKAVGDFGRIDVLVNNAGISGKQKKIDELTPDDWDYVIDVNLKGAFLCTREAAKKMLPGQRRGCSIINISSIHESMPQPEAVPYAASKGGMEMLTKTVALELAGKGIRVNGIAPGAIATDMNREMLEDEQKRKEEEQKIPMHGIGRPEEIAKVALFLASPDASYITGSTIYADGGLMLSS